ncbi:hypothetical protein HMPREF9444_00440 [Succinatimonas hippei YIT 12066]|uniref:Uncharacterized protein n=1 Tax=Succinatimonas hippei (strain DSM 22608 / JCM 16073 / KCTC 15190 / YIT 12066) TaxID=762983 RepID=E8LIC5_SUCHY|nr:hypothetical protein HMPREF9444_00440 [Succinatimonas hippei YIT 12066]
MSAGQRNGQKKPTFEEKTQKKEKINSDLTSKTPRFSILNRQNRFFKLISKILGAILTYRAKMLY